MRIPAGGTADVTISTWYTVSRFTDMSVHGTGSDDILRRDGWRVRLSPLERYAASGPVTLTVNASSDVFWLTTDGNKAPADFKWTEHDGKPVRRTTLTSSGDDLLVGWLGPSWGALSMHGLPYCWGTSAWQGDAYNHEKSEEDRRICRNLPYAAYGRPFKSADLNKLFFEDGPFVADPEGYSNDHWWNDEWEAFVAMYPGAPNPPVYTPIYLMPDNGAATFYADDDALPRRSAHMAFAYDGGVLPISVGMFHETEHGLKVETFFRDDHPPPAKSTSGLLIDPAPKDLSKVRWMKDLAWGEGAEPTHEVAWAVDLNADGKPDVVQHDYYCKQPDAPRGNDKMLAAWIKTHGTFDRDYTCSVTYRRDGSKWTEISRSQPL